MASAFLHSGQTSRREIDVLVDDLIDAFGLTEDKAGAGAPSQAAVPLQQERRRQLVRSVHTLLSLQLNLLRHAPSLPSPTKTVGSCAMPAASQGVDADAAAAEEPAGSWHHVAELCVFRPDLRERLFAGACEEEVAAAAEAVFGTAGSGASSGGCPRHDDEREGNSVIAWCVMELLRCFGWRQQQRRRRDGEPELRFGSPLRTSAAEVDEGGTDAEAGALWLAFPSRGVTIEWAQLVAEAAQLIRRALETGFAGGRSRGGVMDFLADLDEGGDTAGDRHLADDAASLNSLVSAIVVHVGDATRHGTNRPIECEGVPSGVLAPAASSHQLPPPPPPRRQRESAWGSTAGRAQGGLNDVESAVAPLQRQRYRTSEDDAVHNAALEALLASAGNATRERRLISDARDGFIKYTHRSATSPPLPIEALLVAANNASLAAAAAELLSHRCGSNADAANAAGGASCCLARGGGRLDAESALTWLGEIDDDPEVRIVLLNTVAVARAASVATLPLALAPLRRAVAIAEKCALSRMKLVLLHNVARTLERLREFEEAMDAVAEGLALASQLADAGMACRLLGCRVMCCAALREGPAMLAAVRQLHAWRFLELRQEYNLWSVDSEVHRAPLLPKALTALTVYGRFRVFLIPIASGTTTTQQQLHKNVYQGIMDAEARGNNSDDPRDASDLGVVGGAVEAVLRFQADAGYVPMLIGWALWMHVTPDRNILLRAESGAEPGRQDR